MIAYVDTSLMVAWLTSEQRAEDAAAWFANQEPGMVAVSDWTVTEFSAALSRKVRTGRTPVDEKQESLERFRSTMRDTLIVEPVRREHFHNAAHIADMYKLKLQAGDALHLSIAQLGGMRLITLDIGQSDAAEALGIANTLL